MTVAVYAIVLWTSVVTPNCFVCGKQMMLMNPVQWLEPLRYECSDCDVIERMCKIDERTFTEWDGDRIEFLDHSVKHYPSPDTLGFV